MKGYSIEDTSPVKQMIGIEFTGNVIPIEWFNHIKMDNGKPDTIAILILADIVYWYRPIEERNEKTGKAEGYRKKFEGQLLQRSYNAYVEQYGFTKNQVRDAFDRLEKLGVAKAQHTTITVRGQKLGNVMFIDLNVGGLWKITHPLLDLNPIGDRKEPNTPIGLEPNTNTENTPTENSLENSSLKDGAAAPGGKPARTKKPRDERLDNPAVIAYKDEMHLQAPETWRGDIVAKVTNLTLWKKILHEWVGRGWNKQNIKGLIEAYENGGIKDKAAAPTKSDQYDAVFERLRERYATNGNVR